jgi:hypothetical protein
MVFNSRYTRTLESGLKEDFPDACNGAQAGQLDHSAVSIH